MPGTERRSTKLYTPGYIFTLLLGIWVLVLVGCIVLGIVCYRPVGERR